MSVRESAVSGQFYPKDAQRIEEMIAHYNRLLEHSGVLESLSHLKPRAVIAPHAGYIYSAFTANVAIRLLANTQAKRLLVIGPSHRVYLRGSSIGLFDAYETPYGTMPVDTAYAHILAERFSLGFVPDAHHEHSTEVEVPLVRHYLPEAKIIEIVYGDETPKHLAEVIAYALADPQTVTVISTDLSHYYSLEEAKRRDALCLAAIEKLDVALLHQGCEACGKIGVEALLIAAKEKGLKPLLLDYRTSADASGDSSQVVGYVSAAFVED